MALTTLRSVDAGREKVDEVHQFQEWLAATSSERRLFEFTRNLPPWGEATPWQETQWNQATDKLLAIRKARREARANA